jgi:isopentenyl-diphosphate Delta-isomerase
MVQKYLFTKISLFYFCGMNFEEQVVLVNEADEVLGLMPKNEAHVKGLLHRAISVILYDKEGKMILQQRADAKYHWAGVWSNACCTHPRENESYVDCANRRVKEELGILVDLKHNFTFIYKAFDDASGLTEHELDYVFEGVFEGEIPFNENEVKAVKSISMKDLSQDILDNPDTYSFWFKIILEKLKSH